MILKIPRPTKWSRNLTEMQFSVFTQNILNQKFWEWSTDFTKTRGNSDVRSRCFFVFVLLFRVTLVKLELQLPAYTTAIATWDPRHICNVQHSSQQCWIPDPLSEARDQTHSLMDTSQICFCCITMATPHAQVWKPLP